MPARRRCNLFTSIKVVSRMRSCHLKPPKHPNIPKTQSKSTTTDAGELKTFSEKMDHWWELNGPMKGLHSLNELRIPFIVEGMIRNTDETLKNLKLLDVGCGGGILSEALARQRATVTGIDASSELIDVATEHSHSEAFETRPTYYCTTIEDHAIQNANRYDGVIVSEVIEHVNNQELFVQSCVQALKPNGKIFFTTPSKTRLSQFLLIWLAENIIKTPAKGTHHYEKFILESDLCLLLRKRTQVSAGVAANSAEDLKRRKYGGLDGAYMFEPFGVETLGPWGTGAFRVFKDLSERLVESSRDPRAGSYLGQRISLAIQRGNAASILGTLPSGVELDQLSYL